LKSEWREKSSTNVLQEESPVKQKKRLFFLNDIDKAVLETSFAYKKSAIKAKNVLPKTI